MKERVGPQEREEVERKKAEKLAEQKEKKEKEAAEVEERKQQRKANRELKRQKAEQESKAGSGGSKRPASEMSGRVRIFPLSPLISHLDVALCRSG